MQIQKGDVFNQLTVVSDKYKDEKNNIVCDCQCSCGKFKTYRVSQLITNVVKSCGCWRKNRMAQYTLKHNLSRTKLYQVWSRVSKLTNYEDWRDFEKFKLWAELNGYQEGTHLQLNNRNNGYNPENCKFIFPKVKKQKKQVNWHGKSKTRLYRIWSHMRARCNNPKDAAFKHYGSKGIKVCDDWNNDYCNFEKWALENNYLDNLTIERIDVNGNYEPSNCKWIVLEEQAKNRTNNRKITMFGETKILQEWLKDNRIKNTNRFMVLYRLDNGWTPEEAFMNDTVRKKIQITAFGETKYLFDWVKDKRCVVSGALLGYRIKSGWNSEEALTLPVGARRAKSLANNTNIISDESTSQPNNIHNNNDLFTYEI